MIDTARQSWPSPKRPKPIVFLGAGGIVRAAHLPAYREKGFEIAGVFDIATKTAQRLAFDEQIPRVFESLEEACSLEAVVYDLAVPADQILSVLRKLPNGATVLIQKPMGRDLREASRILALCRKKRLVAAVNFQLRFAPNMLVLQHQLARKKLGAIVDVEIRTRTHTPWSTWKFLRGIPRMEILYHSIHYIDLLRACFGEPVRVWSSADADPLFEGYADTRMMARLEFAGGVRASLVTAHSHEFGPLAKSSHVLVEGTRAAMLATMGVNLEYPRGEPDSLKICLRHGDWKLLLLEGSWFPKAFAGTMSNLQRFAAREDPILHTSVADARKTMAVVEACYRSSQRGKTRKSKPKQ
ncbi:MAG TPA: Gfo/Idh/MocA family oxidoreductase [Planctomycetota bacterium]|nr:Gfo/Idh/MocA family oxidoreductase [Planctomycetota bacterium]